MKKPNDMEEFDGYTIPEPHEFTESEKKDAEKRIEELRAKIKEANNIK